MWETRYGLRVDLLAAFAYLLGPISGACFADLPTHIYTQCLLTMIAHAALTLLIMETYNDFVRFHGASHTTRRLMLCLTFDSRSYSLPICVANYAARHIAYLGVPAPISIIPPHRVHAHDRDTILLHGVSTASHCTTRFGLTGLRWQAYIDAARNGLVRFQVPFIGPLAERWVHEE